MSYISFQGIDIISIKSAITWIWLLVLFPCSSWVWECKWFLMRFKSGIVFLCLSPPYQTFPPETPGFRIVETVQKKFTQISKTGIFFSQRRQIWILSYDKVKQTTKLSSSANFPTASIAPENSVFNFMSKFFKILWKTRHLRDGS